jgi:hypothetical protein
LPDSWKVFEIAAGFLEFGIKEVFLILNEVLNRFRNFGNLKSREFSPKYLNIKPCFEFK